MVQQQGRGQQIFVYLVCASLLVIAGAHTVQAKGFRILGQSASATGQGTAFTAQADDPSAIHFNPAGMTQLPGIELSVGASLIGGTIDFTSASGAMAEGGFGSTIANPFPSYMH